MSAAFAEMAGQLKDANLKDPDPAEDPDTSDVPADGPLGNGERRD